MTIKEVENNRRQNSEQYTNGLLLVSFTKYMETPHTERWAPKISFLQMAYIWQTGIAHTM